MEGGDDVERSVTELLDWGACRLKWSLRSQGYRPTTKAPQMVSGSVVHSTIGLICGGLVDRRFMELTAHNFLLDEFDAEDVRKYEPGVLRALRKVPGWVWESQWRGEERLTLAVGDVTVVGRPDLFRVDDDGIELVEFKTTETEPLDFLLWNPQHRYYALMLHEVYPDAPIWFRYVALPTSTKTYREHVPWLFTSRQFEAARRELELVCAEVGKAAVYPNYSRACSFCDYNLVCQSVLTGGSVGGTLKEYFVKEGRHA